MTVEKLRDIHQARPFRLFTLHLADGREVPVAHPEIMGFSPSGRLAHVFYSDDRSEFIDLLLVVSVELGNSRVRRRGKA